MADNSLSRDLELNSIHYYRNSKSDHVFVYNNYATASGTDKPAVIIIPLNDGGALKVPITKLPIDLSEQAPKSEIINSKLFMEMLLKKYLKICPDTEALKVRSDPKAIQELNRLTDSTVTNLDEMFNRESIEVKDVKIPTQSKADALDINLTVMEVLAREDIHDDEKISTIENIADTLTSKDWQYIFDNSTNELKNVALKHLS